MPQQTPVSSIFALSWIFGLAVDLTVDIVLWHTLQQWWSALLWNKMNCPPFACHMAQKGTRGCCKKPECHYNSQLNQVSVLECVEHVSLLAAVWSSVSLSKRWQGVRPEAQLHLMCIHLMKQTNITLQPTGNSFTTSLFLFWGRPFQFKCIKNALWRFCVYVQAFTRVVLIKGLKHWPRSGRGSSTTGAKSLRAGPGLVFLMVAGFSQLMLNITRLIVDWRIGQKCW